MKKKLFVVLMLLSISIISSSVEILTEDYVLARAIPALEQGQVYTSSRMRGNLKEVKAVKVDWRVLKIMKITDNPIIFIDSNNVRVEAKNGDYLISPTTYSRIYTMTEEEFFRTYTLEEGEVLED